jgi:hypothetical protein
LVERLLAKEKVTSSSLVARSFFVNAGVLDQMGIIGMATWPSGKARVCKTLITGSNPVVASESEKAGHWACSLFN